MNKTINVDEVQVGDEIIISAGSSLKYLKVLSAPKLKEGLTWDGKPKYSSARCTVRREVVTTVHNYGGREYKRNRTKYHCETDIEKHNHKLSVNLAYKDIWLVKRESLKKVFS